MLDPTEEDEEQCSGTITLVLKDSDNLCTTIKPGGKLLETKMFDQFLKISQKRYILVNNVLEKAINK